MIKRLFKFLLFFAVVLSIINYKPIMKHFFPTKYSKYVIKYAKIYDLDPYIVYSLIKVESKFNPYAASSKNAVGLMQITPQTGAYIAKLLNDKNYKEDKLYDPAINIRYGCFYLSKLYKDFHGDLNSVLAAYNGGEGNVRKWLKISGSINKLDAKDVPFEETKQYIYKVRKYYDVYKFLYAN